MVDASQRNPSFESLSVPLTALLSTRFEQPTFASNFLAIDIKPAPSGGLTEGTRAEIRMKDKGIFEFASLIDKTRERAVYMKRQQADEECIRIAGNTKNVLQMRYSLAEIQVEIKRQERIVLRLLRLDAHLPGGKCGIEQVPVHVDAGVECRDVGDRWQKLSLLGYR